MVIVGCGAEKYPWDTNNTSPLEGKYETRDTSLDLNKTMQERAARSIAQRVLYSSQYTAGISVSIMYDDHTTLDFAYGCRTLNPEVIASTILSYDNGPQSNCEEDLSPSHRFELGSLTKTAVGRTILDIDNNSSYDFDLNDLITKHLPSNIIALGDLSGITVSHLLHHTSGLAKIDFNPGTVEQIIGKVLAKPRLSRNPGQVYAYNNAGYILLGEIIKEVTGSDSWQGEVLKRLNESIGTNAFIFPESGNDDWLSTNDTSWMNGKSRTLIEGNNSLAVGYSYFEGALWNILGYYSAADIAHSAGSMIGTVPDVTKWMRTVATNETHLLTDDYFTKTIGEINPNTYVDVYSGSTHWNLGAGIGFDQNQNALFHLGNIEGYECHSVYSKNEKVTISACVNGVADLIPFPYDVLKAMYPYREAYLPKTTTTK
jgi:CubicO group peptidase (beta-lactamase class C family)